VIVPGIWNSGPDHWQSRWQAEREASDADAGADASAGAGADAGTVVRIAPSSWSDPDPADWGAAISRAVTACSEPPVLVAHSLGALAVAHWLSDRSRPGVAGAFLVAPPDPAAAGFPEPAAGFRAPGARSSVPTRMVVSDDDPYCSAERAVAFARTLGSQVLRVGALGHVNVDSGVGDWPAGRQLLEEFTSTL
jgi:predicted alpha/beta hydrolase family esterase